MKLNIHIDRLVLDGLPFDRNSAHLVQEAVQAELARLFEESGASPALLSGGAIPSLRTAPVHIGPQSKPHAVGLKVANAVHGGLSQ